MATLEIKRAVNPMAPEGLLLGGEEWSRPTGSGKLARGERDSSIFAPEVRDPPPTPARP